MSFFKRLFGGRTEEPTAGTPPSAGEPSAPTADPSSNPDLIQVFDAYGREMFITKQQWRDQVLPGSLDRARDNPDELYNVIVGSLRGGFVQEVVTYAEHLRRTDPIASRGATLLGIVYLQLNRLDDAERVFQEYLDRHGEDGVLLTNLAKVHAARGRDDQVETTLWRALELEPNQDNGMGWYVALHRDRGGDTGALEALRRVANLPDSWRARLWLARDALQRKDLQQALTLYEESLDRASRPVPADLLMQASGDLGKAGHLDEIVRLVGPHFDPVVHGLQVGNNLLKANLDLGKFDDAKRLLGQLYAQKHADWRKQLDFWDTELAKARLQAAPVVAGTPLSVRLLSIEGPLWMRGGSPFAPLLTPKPTSAPRIAIFGSTALLAQRPKQATVQLSEAPGRLSRALPLVLSEQVHLGSTAVGIALILCAQDEGFVLFGTPYDDEKLCALGREKIDSPAFIAYVIVDATKDTWGLSLRLLRVSDGTCVGTYETTAPIGELGPSVERTSLDLMRLLQKHANVQATPRPPWYERPAGDGNADYLLRLEQQLAVGSKVHESLLGGGLFGEREILVGALQLCLREPSNPTVRMLYAQTLRLMKKVRADILAEFREDSERLQRDNPIPGEVGALIATALAEAFGQ